MIVLPTNIEEDFSMKIATNTSLFKLYINQIISKKKNLASDRTKNSPNRALFILIFVEKPKNLHQSITYVPMKVH